MDLSGSNPQNPLSLLTRNPEPYPYPKVPYPEGPTYTTIMELGPQYQNRDGFLGA